MSETGFHADDDMAPFLFGPMLSSAEYERNGMVVTAKLSRQVEEGRVIAGHHQTSDVLRRFACKWLRIINRDCTHIVPRLHEMPYLKDLLAQHDAETVAATYFDGSTSLVARATDLFWLCGALDALDEGEIGHTFPADADYGQQWLAGIVDCLGWAAGYVDSERHIDAYPEIGLPSRIEMPRTVYYYGFHAVRYFEPRFRRRRFSLDAIGRAAAEFHRARTGREAAYN